MGQILTRGPGIHYARRPIRKKTGRTELITLIRFDPLFYSGIGEWLLPECKSHGVPTGTVLQVVLPPTTTLMIPMASRLSGCTSRGSAARTVKSA